MSGKYFLFENVIDFTQKWRFYVRNQNPGTGVDTNGDYKFRVVWFKPWFKPLGFFKINHWFKPVTVFSSKLEPKT